MKKIISLLPAILFCIMASAQVTDGSSNPSTDMNVKKETTGKVYVMRSTGLSMMMKRFSVFIDDELVCKLDEKRYSVHQLKPGKHYFSVQTGGTKPRQKGQQIEIKVEAGASYYIQMIIQNDIWVANIICQEVTENSANKMMPSLKEEKNCL